MKTRDIKAALIAQIEELRNMNDAERGFAISSMVSDLLSSRVSIKCLVSDSSRNSMPAYNAATDGDYSEWLVSHNID